MKTLWSVCLPAAESSALGALRSQRGLQICEQSDVVWLRGGEGEDDDALELAVRCLPGRRFAVLPDGQLTPAGKRVPCGRLPEGPWVALQQWLVIESPSPALAAEVPERVVLQLVRGGSLQPTNVLESTLASWSRFAGRAPQARLRPLLFALGPEGRVVIRGQPLPPLPGQHFVESEGVAAPAGWTWRPAVQADIVREVLQLQPHDLALLRENGGWERIRGDEFVRATRSAVRLSERAVVGDAE